MEQDEILRQLKQASGCAELSQVTFYKGFRKDSDGETLEVTIELWDGGPNAPADERYQIIAGDELGRFVEGEPNGQLEVAIATTPWDELDEEIDEEDQ